jgi:hypothetical protein
MPIEMKTLTFKNNEAGQRQKVQAVKEHLESGWEIVSETVKGGSFNGKTACCLATIFLPCAFCAGSSDGEIVVTLKKDTGTVSTETPQPQGTPETK